MLLTLQVLLEEYALRNAVVDLNNTIQVESEQISLVIGEGIDKNAWLEAHSP